MRRYEIRLADRGYHVGDILELHEWLPEERTDTGRSIQVRVEYMTPASQWGLTDNHCVMSIRAVPQTDQSSRGSLDISECTPRQERIQDAIRTRDMDALDKELKENGPSEIPDATPETYVGMWLEAARAYGIATYDGSFGELDKRFRYMMMQLLRQDIQIDDLKKTINTLAGFKQFGAPLLKEAADALDRVGTFLGVRVWYTPTRLLATKIRHLLDEYS